jgi:murein DD-endopeptidase MepM/ murein hydrolase activator NlpD
LKWIKLTSNGLTGYVREDFLRFEGDTESFGAGSNDLYPSPIPRSWWVRDFNPKPVDSRLGVEHWGWDFGGDVGSPILAGPSGGVATFVNRCQRCTPSAPSTLSQGLGLGNTSVFSDPAWGFGYGTYVIVRYDHELLPLSTQNLLAARGLVGAHIFVMYAHLVDYSVQAGQTVTPNQQIAGCGNTGNSEAPHLHLEVRAGRNKTDPWSALFANLLDPIVLFRR